MNFEDYVPVVGRIGSISETGDCCHSRMLTLHTEKEIVDFVIFDGTKVIENKKLEEGLWVTAFYDRSLPVPLVLPPRYAAQIILVLG